MAEERALDITRVTSAMDTTRQSIQDTLGELKERVQESADWRHQVARRPLTSLWVAAACGLVLARILSPASVGTDRRSGSSKGDRVGIISLLGQLGAFSPLFAQLGRLVGHLGRKSRR